MTKWLAIVNRRSGGVSPGQWEPILDRVRKLACETVVTEYRGHARELATRTGTFDGLLVVGGDGTLLEAINGLDLLKSRRLAIIPTGRGNSLARDLGLYPLESSFRAIQSGYSSSIDLMEATFTDASGHRTQSLAASTIALGYPAAVVRSASANFRPLGVYSYAAAAACLRPQSMNMRITAAGRDSIEKQLTGFVANNTRHLANFVALPDARCDDGRFDVMEMHTGFLGQCAHNLSALSRLQFYNPVKWTPMSSVSITLRHPQELMVDGDLCGEVVSLQIGLRQAAVEFARPESQR